MFLGGVQISSGNAASCREAGEEPLFESAVPTVDQVQQTASCGEKIATLGAAVFVRGDGAREAVQVVGRIVLVEQRQSQLQRGGLRTEPRQDLPERRQMQRAEGAFRRAGGRFIPGGQAAGTDRLTIGLRVAFEVDSREFQQTRRGEAFVGQYENRGNR